MNKHTLIPRPETELIVEKVLEKIAKYEPEAVNKKIAVVDVGTGSGCIIVSVVRSLTASDAVIKNQFRFFSTDSSTAALNTARKNARRHKVQKFISFNSSDLLSRIAKKLQTHDEIVLLANLPYLSSTLYQNAPQDVKAYEPKTALYSKKKGLDHYRRLFAQIKRLLPEKKVHFFLEISPEQVAHLDFLKTEKHIVPDLSGRPRLVHGSLN